MDIVTVFVEQTLIMVWKHLEHKRLAGRSTLKDMLIPIALIVFWDYIFLSSNRSTEYVSPVYDLRALPPLSSKGEWGIFNGEVSDDDYVAIPQYIPTRRMYYSPNDHAGLNDLMHNFSLKYPGVHLYGTKNSDKVQVEYESHLFDTWASLEFELSEEQISTGKLIPSTLEQTSVNYQLRISPLQMELPSSQIDWDVYTNTISSADAWSNSGYLTIQNFIASELAKQYNGVDPDFEMGLFVQRYPKDPTYDKTPGTDRSFVRFILWKWVASVLLTCAVLLPILGLAAQTVSEKESHMKDLLQISGLLDVSYWISYEIAGVILATFIGIVSCLLLVAGSVLTGYSLGPYIVLVILFSAAIFAQLMAFGFVVFRSEYYGLPAFLVSVALCVAGDYMADNENLTVGLKLFLGFLFPSLNMSMGVFTIETYLFHHDQSYLNYDHVDHSKQLASLSSILGCLFASSVLYVGLCWGAPFDWLPGERSIGDIISKTDEAVYPCDNMDDEDDSSTDSSNARNKDKVLLDVRDIHQVYPDGTRAVRGISFKVKEGEVLSYLGANGAGKSTTMNMLCGTLEATYGDATVNGYSITRNRSAARRNLGICMQQNVIWDDISVEDHLFLFARLRGLTGTALKDDVKCMLEHLGFPEKARSAAGTLSGGQKRRLCVGISMVGGNSVVYLDEPTAGLDPVSRRQLWELIQLNRAGRAILLTTHFLDEADVLGDRIAIVKEGRMRAIGTSNFLKKRFGMGYLLRTSLTSTSKPDDVVKLVAESVPEAEVVSVAGSEFSVRLPRDASRAFPSMFERLDSQREAVGIVNYGIETTTLEEVFIRIVNEDSDQLMQNHQEANKLLAASGEERDRQLEKVKRADNKRHPLSDETVQLLLTKGRQMEESELQSIWKQVQVLMWKRFFQMVRSKGQWMMNVILPAGLLVISAIVMYNVPTDILSANQGPTDLSYDLPFTTPVSGANEQAVSAYIGRAGVSDYKYVGDDYTDLYNYILNNTGTGEPSAAAVYYTSQLNATVMYNSSYPIAYAALIKDILQSAVSNVTDNRLIVNAECVPLQQQELNAQANLATCFFFVACLIAGSLGSGITIVLSGERVGLVKHQQLASGASPISYWWANYLFDYTVATIHALALTFAVYCARAEVYSDGDFGLIFGLGLLFSVTAVYRFYVFSHFLNDIKMAQTFYFYGSLFSMFVTILVYSLTVYTFLGGNASSDSAHAVAVACTVADPTFGYLFLIALQNDFLGVRTQHGGATVASIAVNANMPLVLFLSGVAYFVMLVYLEGGFTHLFGSNKSQSKVDPQQQVQIVNRQSQHDTDGPGIDMGKGYRQVQNVAGDEEAGSNGEGDENRSARSVPPHPHARTIGAMDPDVEFEKSRVADIARTGFIANGHNAIFINRLQRIYYGSGSRPTKVAVKDLSLCVEVGEIFGLLGANGAGKSTLLKMVSGLENPSAGEAYINGFNIVEERRAAQRSMGLCPQFDTLVERLTVRENLLFFGRIKGIRDDLVEPVCEAFLEALDIKRYENKQIQHLSGGNRRKVSLAVALLGSPPTVYLDEPSTGLDPVASRLMWRLLSKIRDTKSCAIILTTHNMMECEAVCTRVGVMKSGELICLGDSMHLRSVHGTGFLLEMNLSNPHMMEACKKYVSEQFTGAVVVDEHATMINFEIPVNSVSSLSAAFSVLEREKSALGLTDYALSQSTLEQVFLKQIRPNEKDQQLMDLQKQTEARVPRLADYVMAYAVFLLALVIPGLHHFYLGNFWRGVKYLCTFNELLVGWFLDLFEMHVLVRKSVEQYGSRRCCQPCLPGSLFAEKGRAEPNV